MNRMGVSKLGVMVRGAVGSTYSPETLAYLAAMTIQPTASQAAAINARIVAIKARAGLWDKLVMLNFYDLHDAQAALLNIVNLSLNSTATNMSFTPYSGMLGTVNGYVDTKINASTNATITADSLHVGAWVSNPPANPFYAIGIRQSNYIGIANVTGSNMSAYLNTTAANILDATSGGKSGYFVATRIDGGTIIKIYKDGVELVSGSRDKTTEVIGNIYVSARGAGAGLSFNDGGITKIAHIGINLDSDDVVALYSAVNNNAIGA